MNNLIEKLADREKEGLKSKSEEVEFELFAEFCDECKSIQEKSEKELQELILLKK